MSILGNRVLGGAGQQPYLVGRSLRFRSSANAYLNRTPASTSNRTTWTWSGWAKRGVLSAAGNLFRSPTSSPSTGFRFTATANGDTQNDGLRIFFNDASSGDLQTTQVFRDPSAWYHIIVAVDTTQATASNRVKLYINGVQVTAFSTATYPTQNYVTQINNTTTHVIGTFNGSIESFDGYLAEVHFIDGQALTPSSFGFYDNNGVWQPRKYGGTYGTNGFYLPFNTNTTSAYATYQSDSSGTYNTLPSGSQGSTFQFPGDFTVEGWVLYTSSSSGDGSVYVINDGGSNYFAFNVSMSAGVYNIYCNSGGPTASFSHGIQAGVWTHIALVRSGSTITAYTNGVSKGTITNSATLGYSSIGFNRLGGGVVGIPRYMSNVRVVKSAVYTSNFTPPTAPLTAIANTLFLTYQNSTAIDNGPNAFAMGTAGSPTFSTQYPFSVGIANDASGNNNNWTPNNISLALGTTYDSMIDSPTVSVSSSNYATLNPLRTPASTTISNGNLSMSDSTNNHNYLSTIGMTSGKWYFEFVASSSGFSAAHAGIAISTISPDTYIGSDTNGYAYHATTGQVLYNNSSLGNYSTWTAGDVIGIAYDANGGNLYVAKNNTWQNSGNPAAGTGAVATGIASNTWFFGIGGNPSALLNANFGQQPFTYTPPSGFNALNTYNLPQPTIMNGASVMAATIWSGDGAATRLISNGLNNTNGVVFQPDFVWLKTRNIAYSPLTYDLIRGASTGSVSAALYTNGSSAEGGNDNSTYGYLSGFNQNGFTVTNGSYGSGTYTNGSGYTYVAWQWNAGSGVTSTNTTGFVSSQVSVNPTAGFSVINYSGNGSNSSVGHSLGVAPNMIIVKSRSNAQDWVVYHSSLGTGKYILLSSTAASVTDANYFTSVTSSAFSMTGSATSMNTNLATYMAYCWSAVAGYSAFGSYTGTSNSDGPFIYVGFRPRFIMVRRTDAAGYDWAMMDTSRDSYNVAYQTLWANLANAEYTTTGSTGMATDILSNGFKIRGTNSENNASGGTYIYAAFAENPFKVSRAR